MSIYLVSIPNKSNAQFEEFVNQLPNGRIHHIYHTDDVTTEELANLLQRHYPEANVTYDPRLAERNYGEYTTMSHGDMAKENTEDVSNYLKLYTWTPPRGESYQQVSERTNQFISELRALHLPEEVVMCIAGENASRAILHVQHGMSLADLFNMAIAHLQVHEVPHKLEDIGDNG